MQDFSSISVSSYEAGALADRLTEQSSEGWSVVAIVPTGSTVTAYLSRPSSGASHADAAASHDETEEVSVDDIVADEIAVAEVAVADVTEAPSGHESGVTDIMPHEVARETTEGVGWAASATGASSDIAPSTPEASAATVEPVVIEPVAEAADTTSQATAAAASAGAAPAGWYADPSSRFELRYWDGSQWTEHVSRSGQQYTDPPVA